ncbi:MAG: CsgG/HfaB family protein [Treponema sp.]
MKKYFLIILFVAIANMAFSVTLTAVVAPFKISDNAVTEDEATQVADLITGCLVNCGLNIVDRSGLEDILEELQFQGSDWSSSKKTAELGRVLNANIIIRGRISKHNATGYTSVGGCVTGTYSIRYHISVSAINVKTAQVIGSASFYWEDIHSRFLENNVRGFYNTISRNFS